MSDRGRWSLAVSDPADGDPGQAALADPSPSTAPGGGEIPDTGSAKGGEPAGPSDPGQGGDGEGPTLRHHPFVEIQTGDGTDRHHPPVDVPVAFLASDRAAADPGRQRPRRLPPAGPEPAARPAALGDLRGVDAVQANPHAGHVERVAIDDPRRTRQRRARRRRRAADYPNRPSLRGLRRLADRARLSFQPFRNAIRRAIELVSDVFDEPLRRGVDPVPVQRRQRGNRTHRDRGQDQDPRDPSGPTEPPPNPPPPHPIIPSRAILVHEPNSRDRRPVLAIAPLRNPAGGPPPDRDVSISAGQGVAAAAPAGVRLARAACPMTRRTALERLAAHRADTFPDHMAGLRIEPRRILFDSIAHDPRRLAANPAIRNAPDASGIRRTVRSATGRGSLSGLDTRLADGREFDLAVSRGDVFRSHRAGRRRPRRDRTIDDGALRLLRRISLPFVRLRPATRPVASLAATATAFFRPTGTASRVTPWRRRGHPPNVPVRPARFQVANIGAPGQLVEG